MMYPMPHSLIVGSGAALGAGARYLLTIALGGGMLPLLILNIVGSRAALGGKLVWILVILFLPLLGLIVWLLAGPRAARAA